MRTSELALESEAHEDAAAPALEPAPAALAGGDDRAEKEKGDADDMAGGSGGGGVMLVNEYRLLPE
jgi:hypothetical protein